MPTSYTQWVKAFFAESGWHLTPEFDTSGTVDFTIDHYLQCRWQPKTGGGVLLSAELLNPETGDSLDSDTLARALRFAWERLPDSPYSIGLDSTEKTLLLSMSIDPATTDAVQALELFEVFRQEVDAWIVQLNDVDPPASVMTSGLPLPGGILGL